MTEPMTMPCSGDAWGPTNNWVVNGISMRCAYTGPPCCLGCAKHQSNGGKCDPGLLDGREWRERG